MKKLATFLLFSVFSSFLFAQNPVKKNIFLEHFTNSKCSTCASKNPGFYAIINTAANAQKINHVAIHPSTPYDDCIYYLANTVENNAWAATYGIQGTPKVFTNGEAGTGNALITQAKIDAAALLTSPIGIEVVETEQANGTDVKVEVTIKTVDSAIPTGNFKLFVAVSEKTVNQPAPFLEPIHHDVFRDMLPNSTGETVILPAVGQSIKFSYIYTIASGWKKDQMFATAFVRNMADKKVLQSANKLNSITLGAAQVIDNQQVSLFPNPATDELTLTFDPNLVKFQTAEMFNSAGQKVIFSTKNQTAGKLSLDVKNLENGVYFLKMQTDNGVIVRKFLKN
jgi:Secretion system C-terminal sorting domain/Outer membrane protein Omp28